MEPRRRDANGESRSAAANRPWPHAETRGANHRSRGSSRARGAEKYGNRETVEGGKGGGALTSAWGIHGRIARPPERPRGGGRVGVGGGRSLSSPSFFSLSSPLRSRGLLSPVLPLGRAEQGALAGWLAAARDHAGLTPGLGTRHADRRRDGAAFAVDTPEFPRIPELSRYSFVERAAAGVPLVSMGRLLARVKLVWQESAVFSR
jgi:hypothetical protein